MAMRTREDEVVFPNAAGIDVGGSSHWVAVPRHAAEESVREFGPMTDDLNAMADWLLACGVDTVASSPPASIGFLCMKCLNSAACRSGWWMRGR